MNKKVLEETLSVTMLPIDQFVGKYTDDDTPCCIGARLAGFFQKSDYYIHGLDEFAKQLGGNRLHLISILKECGAGQHPFSTHEWPVHPTQVWKNMMRIETLPDLKCLNLSRSYLTEINLSDLDLNRVNLSNSNMRNMKLKDTDLSYSNLSQVHMSGVRFDNVDLSYSNIGDSNLNKSVFRDCNFSNSDLRRSDLREADLSNSNLNGANLYCAKLQGANLQNVDLSSVNIDGANLTGACM